VQDGSTCAFNQDTASATGFEDIGIDFPAFGDDWALGPTRGSMTVLGDSVTKAYTDPGTYTFVVPEGVTSVDVTAIGGGSGSQLSPDDVGELGQGGAASRTASRWSRRGHALTKPRSATSGKIHGMARRSSYTKC